MNFESGHEYLLDIIPDIKEIRTLNALERAYYDFVVNALYFLQLCYIWKRIFVYPEDTVYTEMNSMGMNFIKQLVYISNLIHFKKDSSKEFVKTLAYNYGEHLAMFWKGDGNDTEIKSEIELMSERPGENEGKIFKNIMVEIFFPLYQDESAQIWKAMAVTDWIKHRETNLGMKMGFVFTPFFLWRCMFEGENYYVDEDADSEFHEEDYLTYLKGGIPDSCKRLANRLISTLKYFTPLCETSNPLTKFAGKS